MYCKIALIMALVTMAQTLPQFIGGGIAYGGIAAPIGVRQDEYDPHPRYSFEYNVQDPTTGDIKAQQEERDGDVVRGTYSLVEPDGTRRIVDYTADDVNGFNAAVHKEGTAQHAPIAAPVTVHHPITIAQPAIPQGPFGYY